MNYKLRSLIQSQIDLDMKMLDERRVMSCAVSDLNYKTAVKAVSNLTMRDVLLNKSCAVADYIVIDDSFKEHYSNIQDLIYDKKGIDKQYSLLEKTGYIYYLARCYNAIGEVNGLVLRRVELKKEHID